MAKPLGKRMVSLPVEDSWLDYEGGMTGSEGPAFRPQLLSPLRCPLASQTQRQPGSACLLLELLAAADGGFSPKH